MRAAIRGLSASILVTATLFSPLNANGQGAASAITVAAIKELAETVGAVGEALSKLTDGVKNLVVTGASGWDSVSARKTHSRLVALSADLTSLSVSQRITTLAALESFVDKPTSATWQTFLTASDTVLLQANSLLEKLRQERSDFVLESSYQRLQQALGARVDLLSRLKTVKEPTAPAELAEVRSLLKAYRKLVVELEAAKDELNAYLKTKPS